MNTPSDEKLTVAVLEDHRHERMGMVIELNEVADIEVVAATADPEEIINLVKSQPPDVVFIDLKIGGDIRVGIEVIQQIKASAPQVKCIVFTAFPNLERFVAAFDAGAEGFMRKDASLDQQPSLGDLARQIKAGGRYYDADLVGQMRSYLDEDRLPFAPKDETGQYRNPLTKREQEILLLLQKRYDNAKIAEVLVISPNTVKTHIHHMARKLGAKDRHEIVYIAIARGWLQDPDSTDD